MLTTDIFRHAKGEAVLVQSIIRARAVALIEFEFEGSVEFSPRNLELFDVLHEGVLLSREQGVRPDYWFEGNHLHVRRTGVHKVRVYSNTSVFEDSIIPVPRHNIASDGSLFQVNVPFWPQVLSQPEHGIARVSSDGRNLSYVSQGYVGEDGFAYRYVNAYGQVSEPACVVVSSVTYVPDKPGQMPACQADFTQQGANTWVCPEGVTSVSALLVSSGTKGIVNYSSGSPTTATGGDGGDVVYRNNIPVVPGETYTVYVGRARSDLRISEASTFSAAGGTEVSHSGAPGEQRTNYVSGLGYSVTGKGGSSATVNANGSGFNLGVNKLGTAISNGYGKGGEAYGSVSNERPSITKTPPGTQGFARLIWGTGRSWPATGVDDVECASVDVQEPEPRIPAGYARFNEAGTYSLTLPAGIEEYSVLLVGAGKPMTSRIEGSYIYARPGSGGNVRYRNKVAYEEQTVLSIYVPAGGSGGMATVTPSAPAEEDVIFYGEDTSQSEELAFYRSGNWQDSLVVRRGVSATVLGNWDERSDIGTGNSGVGTYGKETTVGAGSGGGGILRQGPESISVGSVPQGYVYVIWGTAVSNVNGGDRRFPDSNVEDFWL